MQRAETIIGIMIMIFATIVLLFNSARVNGENILLQHSSVYEKDITSLEYSVASSIGLTR